MGKIKDKTQKELLLEVQNLSARLSEAEETLHAIRSGEVDALVVSTSQGDQIFTLKGAEKPYRVLMEKMKEGAVTLAEDDTIFYCNQGFADMLKTPLEKMIGTGISQFVSPADKPVFEELLRQGRAGSSKGEVAFLAGDGTSVPTHLSVNVMPLDGLSTVYLVATDITEHKQAEEALQKAHDELEIKVQERTAELANSNEELRVEITERERAQEALRESEQRYATTLASIGDAVIATDVEGRVTFMNAVAEELTGWSLTEAATQPIPQVFNIINEQTRQTVEDPVARVLWYGMIVGLANHTLLIRKDGMEIPIDDSGAPIKNWKGETTGVVLIFRDITERKLAEKALQKAHEELELRVRERTAELEETNVELEAEIAEHKQAEEKIKEQAALLDKAHDTIVLRDLEHRIIYWNKGAEHMYGWTADEAIGKNAIELLYEDKSASPQLIEARESVIEKGEWTGELNQLTRDGEEIVVESRWTLIRDDKETPKSILTINIDITEKKKLESQLLRAQRMESIGTLAGGIAHDLNNLLTPIMLSLQLLQRKLKDEESQKLLTILEQNSQRGANLIKQVLSFARGVEGERKPLQVKHIITEIERIAKETFPRNIDIRTDIQKDLFIVSGDATQLHQVIMNLCVNSRDAMPYGGILNITAKNISTTEDYKQMSTEAKIGPYVLISVSDTGTGIPSKVLDRIFEPFFTTKELGKGTGLGLSTSLAIVKSHGGFINVESKVGEGTIFEVYLPSIKSELQNAEELMKLEIPTGHGELILIAEDEASISEITSSTLKAYGYRVLTAADGADAVALYVQNKDEIKAILMDMMMPIMDGQTSIRAIRRINPEVKIIVVSGLAEKDKFAKVANNDVNSFLPKPYTAERLLRTIYGVISKK